MADGFGAPAFGGAGAAPFQIVRPQARMAGVDYPSPDPAQRGMNALIAMSTINAKIQNYQRLLHEAQIRETLQWQKFNYDMEDKDRRYDLMAGRMENQNLFKDQQLLIERGRLEDQNLRTQNLIDNNALLEQNREATRTLQQERFLKELRDSTAKVHKQREIDLTHDVHGYLGYTDKDQDESMKRMESFNEEQLIHDPDRQKDNKAWKESQTRPGWHQSHEKPDQVYYIGTQMDHQGQIKILPRKSVRKQTIQDWQDRRRDIQDNLEEGRNLPQPSARVTTQAQLNAIARAALSPESINDPRVTEEHRRAAREQLGMSPVGPYEN